MNDNKRPLSPHLAIYRPQVTSILSIFHRVTGVYMFFFIVISVLVMFLFSKPIKVLEYSQSDPEMLTNIWIIMLFGFVFCLSYHLCAGIRYLFWTCNIGLNMQSVNLSAKIIMFCTFLCTGLSVYLFFL
jgi:succinate dehydrogenase / fumarate reductase cytochrome b subunit